MLADLDPECTHVHHIGMERASDTEVWQYAAQHDFTIVSKDADFHQRSLLLGSPPKVVWLRIGNCSVTESEAILRERYIAIRRFIEEAEADYLVLS
jgi:predicted nuclease of predicted toxin-antitoxin system